MTGRPEWNVLFSWTEITILWFPKKSVSFFFRSFWWLDCLKAERGEMPLWNRLWRSYFSSKVGLLSFLHRNVFIKPQPALCCRLKWALDCDEALLPHDLQQGVLFYHGHISGDDLSLAQEQQRGLHMESVCWLSTDQMVRVNRREKLIRIIKTKRGQFYWILYEWSHKTLCNC